MNINNLGSGKPAVQRIIPKPGTQAARLLYIADVGIQPRKAFQGQEKSPVRKLWLCWELVQSLFDYNGKQVPHRISTADLTASNDPKSALSKLMINMDPANVYGGDFEKLLGTPCLITVVHNKVRNKDGIEVTYANIGGVMPAPDGFPVPELTDRPGLFDFFTPSVDVAVSLPKFVRDKITSALNFRDSPAEKIWPEVEKLLTEREAGKKEKEGVAF